MEIVQVNKDSCIHKTFTPKFLGNTLLAITLESDTQELMIFNVLDVNSTGQDVYYIDTHYLVNEEDDKVIKLELNCSIHNDDLLKVGILPGSFVVYGTKNKNIYIEDSLSPLVEINIFNAISENFKNTFNDSESFLSRFLYELPQLYYYNLIKPEPVLTDKLDLLSPLEGTYSVVLNVNETHQKFIKCLLNNDHDYYSENKEHVILIDYQISDHVVKLENNIIKVSISFDFFKGAVDFVKSLNEVTELAKHINRYTIPLDLPPLPEGGGCCGKGGCGSCSGGEQNTGCCNGGDCGKEELPEKKCACGGSNCDSSTSCESSECCKKKMPEPAPCKGSCSAKVELPDLDPEFKLPEYSMDYVLFMKGTQEEPKCKYSRQMVELLKVHSLEYHSVNLLLPENQMLRSYLKKIFPTFPQLWYKNNFLANLDKLISSPELIN